jgi:hypothetical protein
MQRMGKVDLVRLQCLGVVDVSFGSDSQPDWGLGNRKALIGAGGIEKVLFLGTGSSLLGGLFDMGQERLGRF